MNSSDVRFAFRYSSDQKHDTKKKAIRQELILGFAIEHARIINLATVDLYPVSRAGNSGSEVFYLDLGLHQYEHPERFIAKFQTKELTLREWNNSRGAATAGLCSMCYSIEHDSEDVGLIVYRLAVGGDHIEFRSYFLNQENDADLCAEGLKSVFRLLGRHSNKKKDPCQFFVDYEWYLERKTQPLERLKALSSVSDGQNPGFCKMSQAILDHFERIKKQLEAVKVHPYVVHGDLHARNLMMSRSYPGKTELIDFQWCHSGHPAKDFTLMESTLKYMLLPELLSIVRGTSKEQLYIDAGTVESFERYLWSNGLELPSLKTFDHDFLAGKNIPEHQATCLCRVYRCLQEVRSAASQVLTAYCEQHDSVEMNARQHYLSSAFLMTLGQFGIQELEQFWAMIGLNVIGECFEEAL